jgi:hypothetical protein
MERTVKLPRRITHEEPMPLKADAYTVGSDIFIAPQKAKEKSYYYITFRRELFNINPDVYSKGDNRIIFHGLSRLIEYLFYKATSAEEVDETVRFLAHGQAMTTGLAPYPFPKHLWDKIVNGYNGRPPVLITALPEGSVCYPNEAVVCIENSNTLTEDEMGELAA